MSASISYIDPNSSDFASREQEIRVLKAQPATRRAMALGERYQQLQVPIEQLQEVEEDFRKARLFEAVTISRAMREVELDEQRRLVAERQREDARLKQVWLDDFHRLRQKAFEVLAHEADTVRAEEARRLEADKRAILQVERSRLLERRQAFEASTIASRLGVGGGVSSGGGRPSSSSPTPALLRNAVTPTRSATRSSTPNAFGGGAAAAGLRMPPNPNNAPLLVMNVTLGNGREEKITVRVNDDPKRIAVNFAKKHQLPDSAAVNLANQIKAHLSSRLGSGVTGVGGAVHVLSSGVPAASSQPPTIDLVGGRASTPTAAAQQQQQRSLYAGMNISSSAAAAAATSVNSNNNGFGAAGVARQNEMRVPSASSLTTTGGRLGGGGGGGGWGGVGGSPSSSRNSPSVVARRMY